MDRFRLCCMYVFVLMFSARRRSPAHSRTASQTHVPTCTWSLSHQKFCRVRSCCSFHSLVTLYLVLFRMSVLSCETTSIVAAAS